MSSVTATKADFSRKSLLGIVAAFGLLVVYGSLVPFQFKPLAPGAALEAFRSVPYLSLGVASRADWVANIVLYVPISFFLAGALAAGRRTGLGALLGTAGAIVVCVLLAVAIEFAQLFFPPRTVSQNDLIAESTGTVIGAMLWHGFGGRFMRIWRQMLSGGPAAARALVVLYVLAYLAVSLFPYDFLVSWAELHEKLASAGVWSPLIARSCGDALPCGVKMLSEVLVAAPFGLLLGAAGDRARPLGVWAALGIGAALGVVIEGLQVLLASGISQGVSVLTRAVGAAWGCVIVRHFRWKWITGHLGKLRLAALLALPLYLGLLLVLNGVFVTELQPLWRAGERLESVRFLPFYYHYFSSETEALFSLLVTVGAYAPLGVVGWLIAPRRGAVIAAALALAAASCVEALKLLVPGKHPDPTNALIAVGAAWLVHLLLRHVARMFEVHEATSNSKGNAPSGAGRGHFGIALGISVLVIALSALGGWLISSPETEAFVVESRLPKIPPPEELPLASLPGFKFQHPRLPHPTLGDIELIRLKNPGFLQARERFARVGSGDPQAAAFSELARPGSQDLDSLHRRLMQIKFEWRGHDQVKPLVVGFDWLYDYWTPSQREQLAGKLAEGCDYLIRVIRNQRLSPYNVYLYNSPLQALMACSIALYREHPRSESVMAFTYDYWINRVLPVWRQVMGKNGGWHEGGEYIGLGIGQAIYQLPAMWRKATGQDLFSTEPGIRGFLDFMVYRTRPDGTHFRWGDSSFYDKIVPDTVPLAMEYGHKAAYMLRPPRDPAPTSWPWGPPGDARFKDERAAQGLPLTAHFDGMGLIVARSDWSAEATYVTFKAGDNYWSHSHLDQGAFTIYKGGELAIDSGFYGPAYGSDHHMNYTYQTVAHNVVTVTDPDDRVPAPAKDKPRPIANDGGQRRIGSGWGVEAAPLDRAEWEAKRDIYHTGRIERLLNQDDLTVAVTDLTPAYTNARSGRGTFSHRTRRVEGYRRVFGYDRRDDVVVVFDHVRSTRASFRKRWLLHTQQQPAVSGTGFEVSVAPADLAGHAGGTMRGEVLLPRDANMNAIGGPGFEFFVDGRNYDEDGKLRETLRKLKPGGPEPGEWRLEVSPSKAAETDRFLVVMLPALRGKTPEHKVRLLEEAGRVGCEVVGPARTTRWWFYDEGRNVRIEVVGEGGITVHEPK